MASAAAASTATALTSERNVEFLDETYLNRKAEHLGIQHSVNPETFQPLLFTGYGTSLVNSLRKIIMDETPTYALKTSLKLEHYEQRDDRGHSYLDPEYSDKFQAQYQYNLFSLVKPDETYTNYREASGYTKVVRYSNQGENIYNGSENTQILSDRLGYIPINSDCQTISDGVGDGVDHQLVELKDLWIFIGKLETKSDRSFSGPEAVKPIINENSKPLQITAKSSNQLLIVYCQKPGRWIQVSDQNFHKLIPYDTYLTTLQQTQRIVAYGRLECGTGNQYAKWMPVLVRYKFATHEDLGMSIDAGTGASVQAYASSNVNVRQRHFITGTDPIKNCVFLNEPEKIILTLESIGRLTVPETLFRSIDVFQNWLFNFRNNLLNIDLQDSSGTNLNTNRMCEIESYDHPQLIIKLNQCNHSFLPTVVDTLLRHLVWRVQRDLLPGTENFKSYSESLTLDKQSGGKKGTGVGTGTGAGVSQKYKQSQSHVPVETTNYLKTLNFLKRVPVPGSSNDDFIQKYDQELSTFLSEMLTDSQTLDSLKSTSTESQIQTLQQMLGETVLAYRKRHPLRGEAFLTIKYPELLLKQPLERKLHKYFTQWRIDSNPQYFSILTLVLEALDQLDHRLEEIRGHLRSLFGGLPPQYDFDYYQFLRQTPNTVSNLPFNLKYEETGTSTEAYVLPYQPKQSHLGVPYRGQRKLFLSEVMFLSKFIAPQEQEEFVVVYAGAADGSHQRIIQQMFPKVTFVLFDPAFENYYKNWEQKQKGSQITLENQTHLFNLDRLKYYDQTYFGATENPSLDLSKISLENYQYHVFPCFCTTDIAPQLKQLAKIAKRQKILFISDLRNVTNKELIEDRYRKDNNVNSQSELKPFQQEAINSIWQQTNQQLVYDDNYLQYILIDSFFKTGLFVASMIKFRFPYKESLSYLNIKPRLDDHILDNDRLFQPNQFFGGEIFIQAYAKPSTTENRLVTTAKDLEARDSVKTYNGVLYEDRMSYINNVVRKSMKFYTPEITFNYSLENDLRYKYDHALELYILNQYVVKYYKEQIDQGRVRPLDKMKELLYEVERDPIMGKILWRASYRNNCEE